jgi:hypothetical protein
MTILIKILSVVFLFNFWGLGKFTYETENFSESIELLENNKFTYEVRMHMGVRIDVQGTYYLYHDSLYLNSFPQHDKMIVNESANKNVQRNAFFNVKDKDNSPLTYHLYVIFENQERQIFRDQFQQTVISGKKIKEFYIVDTKGLKSPVYKIKGTNVNVFDIRFETKRVFENESWAIKGDSIIPKGFDGEIGKYALTKSN